MNLHLDWDDDYNIATAEVAANGTRYRARLERDDYADRPDGDCYSTVLRIDSGDVDVALSGRDDDLEGALSRFIYEADTRKGIDIFERYVRAFHGGAIEEMGASYDRDGTVYVSVVSRATWVNFWGNEKSRPVDASNDDWQAFIDGDVYSIAIDRASSVDDDGEVDYWTEVEGPIYGHYGDDYAKQAAQEMLAGQVAHDAREGTPDVRPTLPPTMVRVEPGDDIDHAGELIARAHARGLGVSVVIDGASADLA